MSPKEMEDLAAFSARKVKRAAEEERDEYSPAEGQCESQNKKQVIPTSFLKIEGRETFVGGRKTGERGMASGIGR